MRTQVAIIGGGPSGLLLGQLLHKAGIETVILERRSRHHVLSRIRAGVLEWGTVETLRAADAGTRMDAHGDPHDGILLANGNRGFRIDLRAHSGKQVMIYGQTEVTSDLYAGRDATGAPTIHAASDVAPHDLDTDAPYVTFTKDGQSNRIDCDFLAGCDGFHGVSRRTIPAKALREFKHVFPFGWLGVLSETPPATPEILYASHERGFALSSMRTPNLSRYYIQVPNGQIPENWSDSAFWDELRRRLPRETAESLVTGPSVEKSIARLRAYVAEPMRWGRLFLVGDAAHIVPPTGAKGLNLAVGDVHYLSQALIAHYAGDGSGIDGYSDRALARVWQAMRFSCWFTALMHRSPDQSPFEQRLQATELTALETQDSAQGALAHNYVGLPF